MQEGTEESLAQAMRLFASIPGWQDADRQLILCRTRRNRMLWQIESARLKQEEDRFERKVTRRKRALLIALIAVLLLLTVITTAAMLQFRRYSQAAAMYTAGEYERAADAFQAMDGYKDARVRVYLSAIALYHAGKYEEAIPYFEWLGGAYDNGYYLHKCYERTGERP